MAVGIFAAIAASNFGVALEWYQKNKRLRFRQRCRGLSSVTKEAAATTVVDLLADRTDLIEAVTDLRWLEWGHPPEPIDRDWWQAATVREAGHSRLPVTWVASDQSGAQGAVGLGHFDIEERRDRSPWVLGMIVRRDQRGLGIGRLLLGQLEDWAHRQGYQQLWVATGGSAVGFYQRCGWRIYETVERDVEPATVLTKKPQARSRRPDGRRLRAGGVQIQAPFQS